MLASDVISRVRNTAGDTNIGQFTDATMLSWINDGIRECAVENNLLQKTATTTVAAGTESYALPTDILKIHSIKYDGEKIPVYTREEFDARIGDRNPANQPDRGFPLVAYIWASNIILTPAPDNSTSKLQVDYLYTPVDVVAGTNLNTILPVGYHNRLVDYCLAQVAQQDDDMPRYQIKMEEFRTGVSSLKDQDEFTYDLYPSMSVSTRDMGEDAESGDWYGW